MLPIENHITTDPKKPKNHELYVTDENRIVETKCGMHLNGFH
jgi:hypothetical protein